MNKSSFLMKSAFWSLLFFAFADISAQTITKVWEFNEEVPGTQAGGDMRCVTSDKSGRVLVSDKSNKKIIAFEENGQSDYFDYSEIIDEYYRRVKIDTIISEVNDTTFDTTYYAPTGGTAITTDDAGNILVNVGFPNSTSSTDFIIISADLKGTYKLQLSLPDDMQPGRIDQMGRAVGNLLSDEGAYFWLSPNGSNRVAVIKVVNGEQDKEYSQASLPMAGICSTSTIAQPAMSTVAEIDALMEDIGDLSTSFWLRHRTSNRRIFKFEVDEADEIYEYDVNLTDSCLYAGQEGFETFTLGGGTFFVLPMTTDGTTNGRSSNWGIYNVEADSVVASWEENTKYVTWGTGGFHVSPINEKSVRISHFIAGTVVGSYIFDITKTESIALDYDVVSIKPGTTLQMSAKILPENASQNVIWSSTDVTVATVSENGLVSAVREGNTQIIVTTTDGTNLSDTCELTVMPADYVCDFKVGDLAYTITDSINNTVEVARYSNTNASNYTQEEITIPSKVSFNNIEYEVTAIGKSAFSNCKFLTTIVIPNSVTKIGNSAFYGCINLTSLTIPYSVTEIGYYSFLQCGDLTSIKVESGNPKYDSRNDCNAIIETSTNKLILGCKNTIIPNSVTKIGNQAFYFCKNLTSITIPNSVTEIGDNAFRYTGLNSITIPNSVTTIGNYAFEGCNGLISVTIPNSVTSIGNGAFESCDSLTSVTIPNSVTSIGYVAFRNTGLTSIKVESGNPKYDSRNDCNAIIETSTNTLIVGCKNTIIPNSVTTIGERAFDECIDLSSINIPNSVTEIGNYAFFYCNNLTTITIGNSVTKIGSYVFDECSSLSTIMIKSTEPPVCDSTTFSSKRYESCIVVVPVGCVEAYKNDAIWGKFTKIVETGVGLNISDRRAQCGTTFSMPISMSSTNPITAFQCDIHLPQGISVAEIDGDMDIVLNEDRASNDHSLACQMLDNSTLRVMAYSMNVNPFEGNDGEVITINLYVDEIAAEGEQVLTIDSIILSGVNDDAYYAPASSANIEIFRYEMGDANGDKSVDVTDVVSILNAVLGETPTNFQYKVADINGDSKINVLDVVAVAKIILSQKASTATTMSVMGGQAPNMLVLNNVSIQSGETQTVTVSLENVTDFTGFQMDLSLPEGITANNYRLTPRGTVSHALNVQQGDNGITRMISYSPTLATYKNHTGALMTFDIVADETFSGLGEIQIGNIIFADKDAQGYKLNTTKAAIGSISGIETLTSATKVYAEDGQLVIETPVVSQAIISNVAGITTIVDLAIGTTKIDITQGIYIITVNGITEKVIIK